MLDKIDVMKKRTKVRSKQIKAGATGVLYNMLRTSDYEYLFKDKIDRWGQEYKDSKYVCFVELDENKQIMTFPFEDLEEIT